MNDVRLFHSMIWRGRSSSSLAKEGPCVDPSDALRIAKKRKGGSISFSFFSLLFPHWGYRAEDAFESRLAFH